MISFRNNNSLGCGADEVRYGTDFSINCNFDKMEVKHCPDAVLLLMKTKRNSIGANPGAMANKNCFPDCLYKSWRNAKMELVSGHRYGCAE
jgi:hypothetical protein